MRTRKGSARTQARRRLLKRAEGYVGGRRRLLRTAKETLIRAGVYAFRDRRRRRRDFRRLWITRLSAAIRQRGMAYNTFIHGLGLAGIELDRKMLSEMAIHDPAAFDAVVAEVRQAAPRHDAVVST
ncbi:MAG: 50S ribosomal protein L20 [Planctomycetes bacterium]|nr:50S ribosomal protein L20 [Planctomycetota bacterium]